MFGFFGLFLTGLSKNGAMGGTSITGHFWVGVLLVVSGLVLSYWLRRERSDDDLMENLEVE